MSERYTRVFTLEGKSYCPGSPVIIEAGALLKDNQTGMLLAQLKFKNISNKMIQALRVRIQANDISGVAVQGVDDFQYLDLSVRQGEDFGAKTPIILPDGNARSFGCECFAVVFCDGSAWNCDGQWEMLPELVSLKKVIGLGLAEQYKRDTMPAAQYKVMEHRDLWFCACGSVNHADEPVCHNCHMEKAFLIAALDAESLKRNFKAHNAAMLAEQERITAENQRKAKKARLFAMIAAAVVAAVVAAVLLVCKVIIPEGDYADATKLLQEGRFEEAKQAFYDLNGYKNSKDMIIECDYQAAIQLMDEGHYDRSAHAFSLLNGYKDSNDWILECGYRKAESYFTSGQYEEAIREYGLIEEYRDSKDKIEEIRQLQMTAKKEVQYQEAILLINVDNNKAYQMFVELGDYKDAAVHAERFTPFIARKINSQNSIIAAYSYTFSESGKLISVHESYPGILSFENWYDLTYYFDEKLQITEIKSNWVKGSGSLRQISEIAFSDIKYEYDEQGVLRTFSCKCVKNGHETKMDGGKTGPRKLVETDLVKYTYESGKFVSMDMVRTRFIDNKTTETTYNNRSALSGYTYEYDYYYNVSVEPGSIPANEFIYTVS